MYFALPVDVNCSAADGIFCDDSATGVRIDISPLTGMIVSCSAGYWAHSSGRGVCGSTVTAVYDGCSADAAVVAASEA